MSTPVMPGSGGTSRQSGVELLRILAGMAVVTLHIIYFPGGGGLADYTTGSCRTFFILLESLCICAVNVFLLISGAFGWHAKKIRFKKLAMILLETILIRVAANLALCVLSGKMDVRAILIALLPVNYYVILYVVLMLLSPFINAGIEKLSDAAMWRLVLVAFGVFSCFSTLVDVLEEVSGISLVGLSPVGLNGSMAGYSIVQFMLMYLLGACLGREEAAIRRIVSTPLVGLALCLLILLIYLWRIFQPQTAWMYSNPLVIIEGCAVFILFFRLRFSSAWINRVAPASFTCYLIHEYVLYFLDFQKIAAHPFPVLAGIVILIVVGTYALSVAGYAVWRMVSAKLFPDRNSEVMNSTE